MKTLVTVVLGTIILGAIFGAISYVSVAEISPADLVSYLGLIALTLPLGVISGLGTMYTNERALGLLRKERPLSQQAWFRPGIMVGLDAALLGILVSALMQSKFALSPDSLERVLWLVAPATTGLLLPLIWAVGVGVLRFCDYCQSEKHSDRGVRLFV